MILIVTNSEDKTTDYVEEGLVERKINYLRINTDNFTNEFILHFKPCFPEILKISTKETFIIDDITKVWFRRPKAISIHTKNIDAELYESEWPEAIQGVLAHIPLDKWVNHPMYNTYASYKMEQLTRAISLNINVPDTIVTQSMDLVNEFKSKHERIIVKPLAVGFFEGQEEDAYIFTNKLKDEDLEDFSLIQNCPTFFQQAIAPKTDVRINVFGNKIFAIKLVLKNADKIDIRRNNMDGVKYVETSVPEEEKVKLLSLIKSYNLQFAAVDYVIDNSGKWIFLEINPNGQWAWFDFHIDIDLRKKFIDFLLEDL